MAQFTIRLDDELASYVKNLAASAGKSTNAWIVSVLRTASDPDDEDPEMERIRARLARAGLLATPTRSGPARRPDRELVRQARAAAGRGKTLSEIVSEDRG